MLSNRFALLRSSVVVFLAFLSSHAIAQAVTEFAAGVTPGAYPYDIVAGPDGNLWFTEQGLDRIGRITAAGVVTEFSGLAAGSRPSNITVGSDGNLWFTEQGVDRIGRITPNGVVSEFSAGIAQGARPFGITTGSDGNVWFTQTASRVGRITPAGDITQFTAGSWPHQIATGPDGNLWFTDMLGGKFFGGGIARMTPNGAVTELFSESVFFLPDAITAGPDQNTWFTAKAGSSQALQLGRVTQGGATTLFDAHSNPGTVATGIVAGPDGNLWFTNLASLVPQESSRDSIGRITPNGEVTNFAFGTAGAPQRIAAGPDGNLWFTYDGNRIGRITPSGIVTDFTAGLAPGQFAIDITSGPDNSLWFATIGVNAAKDFRIGRITTTGDITNFSVPGLIANDIAAGTNGDLWVTQDNANAIVRVRATATAVGASIAVTDFGEGMTPSARAEGITLGRDGNLWFTEINLDQIARITPAGVITEFPGITAGARPFEIAAAADGNLWFTELGRSVGGNGAGIGRITPAGIVTEFTSDFDSGWYPQYIASGSDGNFWFTESKIGTPGTVAGAIGRITPLGDVTHFILADGIVPKDIEAGPDGNLWFTADYRIGRITPTGAVTMFNTRKPGSPASITVGPDGNFWFTEPSADRVGRLLPVTIAVEFYNASLDHYFMTWMPEEIAKLDAGTEIKGWVRTGYSFKVYTLAQATTVPICRYYIPPARGDSHFYGRDVTECNTTGRKFPDLVLEDRMFMQMFLPADGICPDSTTPVYRVFDNRPDANHRYTTDRMVRDQMVTQGWLAEGDGNDQVVMCAPQ